MTPAPVTVPLPRDRSAPGRARASIRDHAPELSGERLDTAALLVSELVTNAVLHGAGRIVLTIEAAGAVMRFGVSDEGDGAPHVRDDPGPDGGWGLRLVEQLAARWGVRRSGTDVWFEI
jgi:anti-sigma regulatory factor (Ser/Thr protein kinase)